MTFKQTLLAAALAASCQFSFSQPLEFKPELGLTNLPTGDKTPFFILKVDDKSLEFDATKNELLDLSLINPNTIQSICVFQPPVAIENHGNKGKNGAVEISFKDYNLLSEELQLLFEKAGKKGAEKK